MEYNCHPGRDVENSAAVQAELERYYKITPSARGSGGNNFLLSGGGFQRMLCGNRPARRDGADIAGVYANA
jgi:hypothetical protein